ncbi:MAG: hypothetical protein ABIQ31_00675 [Ferruginibacter sp.]
MKKENETPFVVRLSDEQAKEDTKNLRAYIVDDGGKVIEVAAFDNAQAYLKSAAEILDGKTRIYIAPDLGTNERANTLTERSLLKAGAYETVKDFNNNILTIDRIPSEIFGPVRYNNCRITGHVKKNFLINNEWQNLPLCDLRVHICEIETELVWPHIPIYYRPIPDWVIQEIGEKFINIIKPEIPPVPGPIGPISRLKTNLPLRSLTTAKPVQKLALREKSLAKLPDHVQEAMTSRSVDVIRKALIDYHDLVHPYLCLWPIYWPWIYDSNEIAVVTTDCNGHFEKWVHSVTRQGPVDIYVWVEAFIDGSWVTVYKPFLPCYTRWNYQCGTEITINITDPRVVPCGCGNEGPADAFWFRSVGSSGGALHIEQRILHTVPIQGVSMRNAGCTDILGISDYISPFGGALALQVFAGENIYNSGTGVTHFRWKVTRVANENLDAIPTGFQTTTILNATSKVYREYLVKLDTVHYHSFNLEIAPDGTGADIAFRIPNQDITQEPTIMAAYPTNTKYWRDIFWTSAFVDSNSLSGNGLYRFDLELGKYSGSNFIVTEVDPSTFQISELNDLDSSQDATLPYLKMNLSGKANNYRMFVRIDNEPCEADIQDVLLNETGALSGPCGFIKYDNTGQHTHISFKATHLRNFAKFSFGVVKGNNTVPTGINPSGYVISGVDGFALSGGLFNDDFTVLELLNGCPGQAAFSENLYVSSLATDGTQRLIGYDRSDTNAFALSNT